MGGCTWLISMCVVSGYLSPCNSNHLPRTQGIHVVLKERRQTKLDNFGNVSGLVDPTSGNHIPKYDVPLS